MGVEALLGGAIAAPIVGGLLGKGLSGDDRDSQAAAQQAALAAIQGVQTPDINSMQLALQQYQSAGQLTPDMEATIAQDPSLMAGISTDPRLKQAQMASLTKLMQYGQGGLQPEDIAQLAQIQKQGDISEQAKQGQIMQDMQSRGMAGQGSELASRLSSAQGAANRLNDQDLQVNSMASQRAMQSLVNAGQLGGSMQAQDFSQQAQQAAAQDAINRFNAANQQAVTSANTNRANYGQQYNLEQAQQLQNQNTALSNQQQQYNKQLIQQNYNNQLQKAGATASAEGNIGNYYGQQAQNTQNMWGGLGQGVGGTLGGLAAFGALGNKLSPGQAALNGAVTAPIPNNTVVAPSFGTGYPGN